MLREREAVPGSSVTGVKLNVADVPAGVFLSQEETCVAVPGQYHMY
jgi:hypothetical protein